MESRLYFPVFGVEGGIGDGSTVGIDIQRNAGAIEFVDGVMVDIGVDICLQIAGGAAFEEDIFFFKGRHECGVFDGSDTVAYAGWVKVLQGLPNALGAFGFACVGSAGDMMLMGVLKGGDMVVDGEASLAGGDVESDDMGTFELLHQLNGLHALGF